MLLRSLPLPDGRRREAALLGHTQSPHLGQGAGTGPVPPWMSWAAPSPRRSLRPERPCGLPPAAPIHSLYSLQNLAQLGPSSRHFPTVFVFKQNALLPLDSQAPDLVLVQMLVFHCDSVKPPSGSLLPGEPSAWPGEMLRVTPACVWADPLVAQEGAGNTSCSTVSVCPRAGGKYR